MYTQTITKDYNEYIITNLYDSRIKLAMHDSYVKVRDIIGKHYSYQLIKTLTEIRYRIIICRMITYL
jgi:hypothetical protein